VSANVNQKSNVNKRIKKNSTQGDFLYVLSRRHFLFQHINFSLSVSFCHCCILTYLLPMPKFLAIESAVKETLNPS